MTTPQFRPYQPSMYSPGSLARFRQYPRVVRAVIPGVGYKVGKLFWGEQELDLENRSRGPYPYGRYNSAPLRGLGSAALTPAQANAAMGWTPAKLKAYYNARAQACRSMADEGACLARVARHVPVTIGTSGLGLVGLGQLAPDSIATYTNLVAQVIRDPEGTLRVQGTRLVNVLDRLVVTPLVDRVAAASAPYAKAYILPPLAILYVLTGVGAWFSYQAWSTMAERAERRAVKANRRRRRRR